MMIIIMLSSPHMDEGYGICKFETIRRISHTISLSGAVGIRKMNDDLLITLLEHNSISLIKVSFKMA